MAGKLWTRLFATYSTGVEEIGMIGSASASSRLADSYSLFRCGWLNVSRASTTRLSNAGLA